MVAVDGSGNVAALLHTSNATTWGLLGLMFDGVGISDPARYQQRLVARVGPGARLPDPTNPAIVLRSGVPVLASNSIGVELHEQAVQSLVNVPEYGMDVGSAADAAQFLRPVGPGRPAPGSSGPARNPADQVVIEGAFAPSLVEALRAVGRGVAVVPRARAEAWIGAWAGLTIDPATGLRSAALQGVSNGWALAY